MHPLDSGNITIALPAELLEVIFFSLINPIYDSCYDEDIAVKRAIEASSIRSVSQVCRFWRETALGCSSLWVYGLDMNTAGANWVNTAIQRTKSASLVVQAIIRNPEGSILNDEKWFNVLIHFYRFRVLHLFFIHPSFNISDLRPILSQPTPVLESFLFCRAPAPRAGDHPNSNTVSVDIFGGNAPSLKSLYLFGGLTPTRIPFRLSNLAIISPARLRHSKLLDILEHQPTLEMLQLSFSVALSSRPSRTMHLPSLQTLWLSDQPRVCAVILDHLTTPPSCVIRVTITQPKVWIDGAPNCLLLQSAFSKIFKKWKLRKQHTAWVLSASPFTSHIVAFDTRYTPSRPLFEYIWLGTGLSVQPRLNFLFLGSMLTSIQNHCDLGNAYHLLLDCYGLDESGADAVLTFMNHLKNLREIRCTPRTFNWMTVRIFSDLALHEPLISTRETLAFPELRTIYLEKGELIALGEGISHFFEVLYCILGRSPKVESLHMPEDSPVLMEVMQFFQHPMLAYKRVDVCTHTDKERLLSDLAENVIMNLFAIFHFSRNHFHNRTGTPRSSSLDELMNFMVRDEGDMYYLWTYYISPHKMRKLNNIIVC